MSYTYDYPRPAVTVDCIVLIKTEKTYKILLIERKNHPFKNFWAFPGGFIDEDETTEMAVSRELKEETGLENISLKQFYTFSDPFRDPRGRSISVIYYGFTDKSNMNVIAGDDALSADWFDINNLPDLAFDHQKIFEKLVFELKLQ